MKRLVFLFIVTFCLEESSQLFPLGSNILLAEEIPVNGNTCEGLSNECIGNLDTGNKVTACEGIMKYKECIDGKKECHRDFISKSMAEFMTQAGINKCPELTSDMCLDLTAMETCELAFDSAIVDLDLKEHTETKCRLAASLERCVDKKGKCVLQTKQNLLKKNLGSTDCSEFVDACSKMMEENCTINYATSKKDKCENLKDLSTCLRDEAFCPQSRIHVTTRKMMIDQSFDCSDVNACNEMKYESCEVDVFANTTDTKERLCIRFKDFKNCMGTAQCNELYLNSKILEVEKELKNPCDAASAILASIGLTLLLAIFTSLWK